MAADENGPRRIVSVAFARVQDGVYVVLGLLLPAELGAQAHPNDTVFRQVMWGLSLLTALILVRVGSVVILRRRAADPPPAR